MARRINLLADEKGASVRFFGGFVFSGIATFAIVVVGMVALGIVNGIGVRVTPGVFAIAVFFSVILGTYFGIVHMLKLNIVEHMWGVTLCGMVFCAVVGGGLAALLMHFFRSSHA